MIIDAHAHITYGLKGMTGSGQTRSLDYGKVSWGGKILQFIPPATGVTAFPPEVLLQNLDWAGVDKAVILQGPFYGEQNNEVSEAVRQWPDRFFGAAYIDPWQKDAEAQFESVISSGSFCAVKLECSVAAGLCGIHPEARLDDPELGWLWDGLERERLVLTLDLGAVGSASYQTEAVQRIAQSHPKLRIVIAHLGQPSPQVEARSEALEAWKTQLSLGILPNVWFDMASLIAYLPNERYPFPSARRYLQEAVTLIGADRIMWGSDQPGTLSHLTYLQYVELAHEHVSFLSSAEQQMILGETALMVYGDR